MPGDGAAAAFCHVVTQLASFGHDAGGIHERSAAYEAFHASHTCSSRGRDMISLYPAEANFALRAMATGRVAFIASFSSHGHSAGRAADVDARWPRCQCRHDDDISVITSQGAAAFSQLIFLLTSPGFGYYRAFRFRGIFCSAAMREGTLDEITRRCAYFRHGRVNTLIKITQRRLFHQFTLFLYAPFSACFIQQPSATSTAGRRDIFQRFASATAAYTRHRSLVAYTYRDDYAQPRAPGQIST